MWKVNHIHVYNMADYTHILTSIRSWKEIVLVCDPSISSSSGRRVNYTVHPSKKIGTACSRNKFKSYCSKVLH